MLDLHSAQEESKPLQIHYDKSEKEDGDDDDDEDEFVIANREVGDDQDDDDEG